MEELMGIYIEDMKEYLAVLNDSIVLLERDMSDKAAIGEMFRAFHTMKSSTAAMEYKRTAGFIHSMEDLLHEIREGRIPVKTNIIRLFYDTYDLIEEFVKSVITSGKEGDSNTDAVLVKVKAIIGGKGFPDADDPKNGKTGEKTGVFMLHKNDLGRIRKAVKNGDQVYKITVELAEDCYFKSVRAWMMLEEIAKVSRIICSSPVKPDEDDFKNGEFKFDGSTIQAHIASEMSREELMRELDNKISEIKSVDIEAVKSEFTPVNDDIENVAGIIEDIIGGDNDATWTSGKSSDDGNKDKIGELLVQAGCINPEDVDEIIKKQKESYPDLKFGQIAVNEEKVNAADILNALNAQGNVRRDINQAYIRIPANKVDNMVDLMGELLITQSLHKQEITDTINGESRLLSSIIRMERIAKDLQSITMSLRMVSLKQTFQKIYRIGRDTAEELGKNIIITTSGEETEIDRNVVDKIHDPLMHLIRNAISHGIEEESIRLQASKPAAGNIAIVAYNQRGNVCIEVSDDGKGLSLEKIFKKASEKGLIDPSRKYADDEILKLIYLPGFSTEENVNNVSGRGVGMNVVMSEISRLGGRIDIDNSPGSGCTFILKIPVNLATINGTIIDIYGSRYIIPTLNIKQILKPEQDQWISFKGKRSMALVRNEVLSIIPMGSILGKKTDDEDCEMNLIMVVEHEKKLMVLPVRSIQGKQEIVVKSIGSDFRHLNFISGATILGDGRVSLILDIDTLFKMTESAKPGKEAD